MSSKEAGTGSNDKRRALPSLPMALIVGGQMAIAVLVVAILVTTLFHQFISNRLLKQLDAQLYAAAYFARSILPPDFHDKIDNEDSLAPEVYENIVIQYNRLCRELGLQYLWSCLLIDNEIVFTTATSPEHDIDKQDHAAFFETHSDPQAFDKVFSTMQPDYSSFHNEWGHGRMVLVPFRDRKGRSYCFGASMSIDHVVASQREMLIKTVLLGMGLFSLILLCSLLLTQRITRRIREITASANKIRDGNLNELVPVRGPTEVRQLAEALNAMRLRISNSMQELLNAQNEHQALLTNIAAGVVIHAPDTQITYSNSRASEILGLSSDQMLGKVIVDPAWAFIHEDGQRMQLSEYPVSRVIASREPLVDYVVGINRPDQPNPSWVLVNAFPEFDADNELRQVVVSFVDISTIKHLEAQLFLAQKMEAVGQLAGGVAHDFNNILQAIEGYAQLAEQELGETHPAHQWLVEIFSAADRAANVIKQLLAFSRRQLLEPSYIQMNEVIESLTGMLQRLIGEHIKMDFVPGHRLGTVYADRTMMEQAIINLCVNARDAMPEGGHLSIETENVLLDQDYCMQNIWATPGRYVLISVTDTGMGMTDDTLDHIFEPFFTTKKEGEGTGLGLATVYGAVRQQDGMVRVYSEIDKGTTFKIYLPVVERTADAVGTKIRTLPKSGTETILVAEDDTSLGNLAKLMLERDGYTVILASNGKEAVERYAEQPDKIDLLLLDVVMPIMGGREAFDRIREMDPDVPILFASGYSQNAIHTNFVIQTDKKILHKPYSANELRRALRDALD